MPTLQSNKNKLNNITRYNDMRNKLISLIEKNIPKKIKWCYT